MIVDTHCHIDRFPNPRTLADKCEKARVMTIAVTNLPSHYSMSVDHLGEMRFVRAALGFHPLAVAENLHELPLFESLLQTAEFVGEIGLDYSSQGIRSKDAQIEAFRSIAGWLSSSPRFVTLHSRKSASDVLAILSEFGIANAIFHWYSDSISVLRRAIDSGFYFSVNTAMLLSKSGQSVLQAVPRHLVLTETDGPYVKIGRNAASPLDVEKVIAGIAEVWDTDQQVVRDQIEDNFRSLCEMFSIHLPE